jgi:hypothetical protein
MLRAVEFQWEIQYKSSTNPVQRDPTKKGFLRAYSRGEVKSFFKSQTTKSRALKTLGRPLEGQIHKIYSHSPLLSRKFQNKPYMINPIRKLRYCFGKIRWKDYSSPIFCDSPSLGVDPG